MDKYLTKCHPDFHIPGDLIVGENFDCVDYVRRMKEAKVDSLVFFAKCHYGHSYYYTKVGTVHPNLKTDMMRTMIETCEKEGVGLSLYYSVFLDTAAVRQHPEWRLVASTSEIEGGFNSSNFEQLCVNSGYLEELLIPQVLEILDMYDIQEIFFDTMTGFVPCYCEKCREKFGAPIPTSKEDPNWSRYVKWYCEQYDEFFEKVLNVMHEKNPRTSATFNWQWSARLPATPAKYNKRLAGDLFPSGSTSSYFSRYWAGTGYPFDFMCGRFMHGLGEWGNNTLESLKYTAAGAIANGGSFYLIDRQLPNGKLEDRAWPILKEVCSFIKDRESAVLGTMHIKECAVLYSFEHIVGKDLEFFPDIDVRDARQGQLKAIAEILRNNGIHYTAVNTDRLLETLDSYKLVILPEIDFVSDELREALNNFVQEGGNLLIVQSEFELDKDILEMAGVEIDGYTDLEYAYIENQTEDYADPIMVRRKSPNAVATANASVLRKYMDTSLYGNSTRKFGHGHAPVSGIGKYAAIIKRELGEGEIIYVAPPVLTSHQDYYNPQIAKLIVELIEELNPQPLVRVKSKAQVELALTQKEGDLMVHLVNHSGKEVLAGYWCPIVDFIPTLTDVEVEIKAKPGEKYKIVSCPGNVEISYEEKDGYMRFKVPQLHIMESFIVSEI